MITESITLENVRWASKPSAIKEETGLVLFQVDFWVKQSTKFYDNLLLFTMDSCLLVKNFAPHIYHNWKASAHQYSFLFVW